MHVAAIVTVLIKMEVIQFSYVSNKNLMIIISDFLIGKAQV